MPANEGFHLKIRVKNEDMHLLPSGAIYLPAHQSLLIADAHIGKASSFRQLGVPVPSGTTNETLTAISQDLQTTGAQHLIFLGDFLHSRHAHATATQNVVAAWREQHAQLAITLVRGNHDDKAGDPPAALRFSIVNEPLILGSLALCHHPQTIDQHYVLAGHLHPCITLQGKARDRLRLPCFWMGDEAQQPVGILPAYGSFTGMHPIERRDSDAVYAVAGDVVRKV
ncbi:ligase-associated DNA damage response endonuclease PdeM [Variovorax sp. PCZ-1]|uniref:ligase-associated DNA damage response endonuclease PdeM n=1 Tax=Variovorax sp. PCZ-1 TaxID=2835533 RepID=UPI001BCDD66F|nr:ligase-associated DNA damage response endonuclease PdeM [Variovorax sp. PCZ-1]MBS7808235.1 ligase-associated DNA damage response endonuclease PdeM [Variovorax sp. PCZ-1]